MTNVTIEDVFRTHAQKEYGKVWEMKSIIIKTEHSSKLYWADSKILAHVLFDDLWPRFFKSNWSIKNFAARVFHLYILGKLTSFSLFLTNSFGTLLFLRVITSPAGPITFSYDPSPFPERRTKFSSETYE